MKKALRNIVLFTLFFSLIVLVSFAKHEQEKTLVRNVIVSIDITQGDPFMDQNDIRDLVYSRQDTLMGKPLSSLHLEEVEKLLEEQTAVKSAEVYTGHNGDVHLEITLKKVIARIKPDSTSGFYVDDNGGTMEWTSKYSPRVLLVTGHLSQYNRFLKDTLVKKDVINHTKLINDVYAFAEYVRKDSFWRSQIGQVYINEKGDAVLVPLLGREEFIFGELTNYKKKLGKIKRYYDEIAPKMGWNKYQEVNVKFERQIVCK
jgi:cell division protein FtsQ